MSRPDCIKHWKQIQEPDNATYPDSQELLSIGSPFGRHFGFARLGIHHELVPPGRRTSWPHCEETEDEFIYVIEGELVLAENGGETVLHPGDAAGWKAGVADGHCLINRTARDAVYLEIGTRAPRERAEYPDIDMVAVRDGKSQRYLHKSGAPYPGSEK